MNGKMIHRVTEREKDVQALVREHLDESSAQAIFNHADPGTFLWESFQQGTDDPEDSTETLALSFLQGCFIAAPSPPWVRRLAEFVIDSISRDILSTKRLPGE